MKIRNVSRAASLAIIAFTLAGTDFLAGYPRGNETSIRGALVPQQQPIRLAGGFIQYTDKTLLLAPDKWKQLVTRLNTEAGMNTIIIQRLASPGSRVPDDGVPQPDKDEKGKYTDHKFYEADLSDPIIRKTLKPLSRFLVMPMTMEWTSTLDCGMTT